MNRYSLAILGLISLSSAIRVEVSKDFIRDRLQNDDQFLSKMINRDASHFLPDNQTNVSADWTTIQTRPGSNPSTSAVIELKGGVVAEGFEPNRFTMTIEI